MPTRHRSMLCLLPGLGGTGKLYQWLGEAINDEFDFRVIVYEDGSTLEDFVASALRQIPEDRPVSLVAESFSGAVAIALLASRTRDYGPSVLCNTFASPPYRALLPLIDFVPDLFLGGGALREPLLKWVTAGRFVTQDRWRRIMDSVGSLDHARVRGQLQAVRRTNVEAMLPRIDVPMLYLQSTHDRLIRPTHGRRIIRELVDCVSVSVNGPHMLLQCAPEACFAHIRAHVLRDQSRRRETVGE